MVFSGAWIVTPKPPLPSASVPSAVVPITLPSILLSVASGPEIRTPSNVLPEMTLRSSGCVPPSVLDSLAKYTPY